MNVRQYIEETRDGRSVYQTQVALAKRAGVSVTTIRSLYSGAKCGLRGTAVAVSRATRGAVTIPELYDVADTDTVRGRILAIEGEFDLARVRIMLGNSYDAAFGLIRRLINSGHIQRVRRGVYIVGGEQ